MPNTAPTSLSGEVTDVFAHRFVVKTSEGTILADLGPAGTERIKLEKGDHVELSGEMKPSEVKVGRIAKAGERPVTIEHGKAHHHEHEPSDWAAAARTVEANGFTIIGGPRRKPKHVELLGRDKAGDLVELHVALDGTLRQSKPVAAGDPKWAGEMEGSGAPDTRHPHQ